MENYYVGSDLKFKIDISGAGFDMHDDDFYIELQQGTQRVKIAKDELVEDENSNYYLLLDTTSLGFGLVKMAVTAFVPDADFPDGMRREVNVIGLCNITKAL
jgi:hypothetical protein